MKFHAVLFLSIVWLSLHNPTVARAAYVTDVIADGAVSRWDFEEANDRLLADRIGSNTGTAFNSRVTKITPARVGNGYAFEPLNGDCVALPEHAFDDHVQGAIEAIVKIAGNTETYTVLAAANGGSSASFTLEIDEGKLAMTSTDARGVRHTISGSTTLDTEHFYHLVWQMDATLGATLLINGIPETLVHENGSPPNVQWWKEQANETDGYTIGCQASRGAYRSHFRGVIDELAVYPAPLDPSAWYRRAYRTLGETIVVTSPKAYQVFQRDRTDRSDIFITGTYLGSPAAIEASWNGGPYAVIDAHPARGAYAGTLPDQPAGQGALSVRFSDAATAATSVAYVGVGDVFLVAGQSNAEGRGSNAQTYSHPTLKAGMFRERYTWRELADPTDVDGLFSVWPLVATPLMANQNVPVAFITAAEKDTGLAPPQSDWGKGKQAYRNALATIQASGVNRVKAVLWHQGESDATNGVSRRTYLVALSQMLDELQTDTGFTDLKLVAASLGAIENKQITRPELDAIRLGIADAWEQDSDILPGPVTYDVNLGNTNEGNGIHFETNDELRTLADRWWATIKHNFYGGADGRGPRLRSAQRNREKTEITLVFSDETLPLTPPQGLGGFRVLDDGNPVAVTSVQRTASDTVKITLAAPASGALTISLGSFNDGAGAAVPRDSSPYRLPAEIFVAYPATPPAAASTGGAAQIASREQVQNRKLGEGVTDSENSPRSPWVVLGSVMVTLAGVMVLIKRSMRVFLAKVLLLAGIVACLVFLVSHVPTWRYDFANSQTESNLFVVRKKTHYDLLVLGTSHARIFSRTGNHERVEEILGASMLNLSTGGGRGVYASRIFFDYFLSRGNTAGTVVYFIDPWVLYSQKWNEDNDLFSNEPITPAFLSFIVRRGVNAATIANYLKTKVSWEWVRQSPKPDTENNIRLDGVDGEAVAKRVESLYPDGLESATFEKYRTELSVLTETANANNIRLVFIIPTTLLGDMPGEDALKQALDEMDAEWYDLSNAITDPHLYYDHDHLNTAGIVAFTQKYLRPILSGNAR